MKDDRDEVYRLPDGTVLSIMSGPLPKGHWIYEEADEPPMPFKMGTDDPRREEWTEKIRAAGRYAVRGATMSGKESDFDPDALLQNLIVGMLGYNTPDGDSHLD